jgi:hypothetical protein
MYRKSKITNLYKEILEALILVVSAITKYNKLLNFAMK